MTRLTVKTRGSKKAITLFAEPGGSRESQSQESSVDLYLSDTIGADLAKSALEQAIELCHRPPP